MASTADHKQQALAELQALRAFIDAQSACLDVRELVDLIGPLERAIQTFHMEAIRFPTFTIGHRLAQTPGLAAEAVTRFEQVRASLEGASFHTRSVSS